MDAAYAEERRRIFIKYMRDLRELMIFSRNYDWCDLSEHRTTASTTVSAVDDVAVADLREIGFEVDGTRVRLESRKECV